VEKEFSAGAIIFRKEEGKPLFLLIYSRKNRMWVFPKGHIESGESEKEAAAREIMEEAGISGIRFVDGFREENVYNTVSNRGPNKGSIIEKHAIFFLCESKTADVKVDMQEMVDHKWLVMDEAMKLIKFDVWKQMLARANLSIIMKD